MKSIDIDTAGRGKSRSLLFLYHEQEATILNALLTADNLGEVHGDKINVKLSEAITGSFNIENIGARMDARPPRFAAWIAAQAALKAMVGQGVGALTTKRWSHSCVDLS